MERTIGAMCKLCGVSERTLRYYDEIGLLRPSRVSEAGYRLYDEACVEKMRRILLFRETGLPLEDVARVLDGDAAALLRKHRNVLCMQRTRTEKLIEMVDRLLKGEVNVGFEAFDNSKVEKARAEYAQEAKKRWGETDAYKQSAKRTAKYGKEDWARLNEEARTIFQALADAMPLGASSAEAQAAVECWRDHITQHYYDCTKEILSGLGEMYVADERFASQYEAIQPGLAAFFRDAIAVYCAR